MNITIAASHGLIVGDTISMPVYLTRWERLLLWLARPGWYVPRRVAQGSWVVTHVTTGSSFEVDTSGFEF